MLYRCHEERRAAHATEVEADTPADAARRFAEMMDRVGEDTARAERRVVVTVDGWGERFVVRSHQVRAYTVEES